MDQDNFIFVCRWYGGAGRVGVFYGFNQGIGMEYMLATAAAFCLATLYHYFLGNILVFTSGARYEKGKELSLVFAVSIMGLAFNLILMYIFVGMMLLQPMFAKVLASCIVVIWNYLARKKWIF